MSSVHMRARSAAMPALFAALTIVGAGSILVENLFHLPAGWVALLSFAGVIAAALLSSYYLVLIAKRTLALYDTVILGGIFFFYLAVLQRMPAQAEEEKDELLAPPRALVDIRSGTWRAAAIVGIFVLGGCVMGFVA